MRNRKCLSFLESRPEHRFPDNHVLQLAVLHEKFPETLKVKILTCKANILDPTVLKNLYTWNAGTCHVDALTEVAQNRLPVPSFAGHWSETRLWFLYPFLFLVCLVFFPSLFCFWICYRNSASHQLQPLNFGATEACHFYPKPHYLRAPFVAIVASRPWRQKEFLHIRLKFSRISSGEHLQHPLPIVLFPSPIPLMGPYWPRLFSRIPKTLMSLYKKRKRHLNHGVE